MKKITETRRLKIENKLEYIPKSGSEIEIGSRAISAECKSDQRVENFYVINYHN